MKIENEQKQRTFLVSRDLLTKTCGLCKLKRNVHCRNVWMDKKALRESAFVNNNSCFRLVNRV